MNKKIIIVLCILFISANLGFASGNEYKTANAFVRVTTNMLGYNWVAKKVAQSVLKRTLNKSVKGDYKVKFDSFSGVDLKKGKFRGLYIEGANLCADNELYISKIKLKTINDFNYVDYRKDPLVFKTDVPMSYDVEITEDNLNKMLSAGKSFETFSNLIPLVTIKTPSVKISDDKIRMSSSLKLPFGKTIKFTMTGGLKVENGKIVFTDVKTSNSKNEFVEKMVNLINNQNVLENINMDLFDGADTKMAIDKVYIKDKTVYVNGNILIKKAE